MKRLMIATCALSMTLFLAACSDEAPQTSASDDSSAMTISTTATATKRAKTLADGTYALEVQTDSDMFRAERGELKVENGANTATITLPGDGFTRLYFGTAEEAAAADQGIVEYQLDEEGKYTFTLPVSALDEELPIAAYGPKRDKWYDHTILFHVADATN